LILALLAAPDERTAAETAGVSLPTLYRALRCPEFSAALEVARRDFRQASIAELARRQAAHLQPV
jgi:hypothetical protein